MKRTCLLLDRRFFLYNIYYDDAIVYVGRTKQKLTDRLKKHFFTKSLSRLIDIQLVSKIEYAEFETEADMFLYELYYINLFKPLLNTGDKANDALTIDLPSIKFDNFSPLTLKDWKEKSFQLDKEKREELTRTTLMDEKVFNMHNKLKTNEITENQYWEFLEKYHNFKFKK